MLLDYIVPFLAILTALVFVHELGHYLLARWAGVKVEVFSVGFGPELFGRTDRSGTRWRVSAVPLGGYVKMLGDEDPASLGQADVSALDEGERRRSFHVQPLRWRTAIVAAGPIANFLFAIVLLVGLYVSVGQPYTPAAVDAVQPGSAAEAAGLVPGDRIVAVEGASVERFEELQRIVQGMAGRPLAFLVERDGERLTLTVTPRATELVDRFGNRHQIGVIGVRNNQVKVVRHGPLDAVWEASRETVGLTVATLRAVGQIIVGARGTEELGGPLRIAQMSGDVAQGGIASTVWFMALLSINLGLINLFPIPVLDGGHLLFYAAEAFRGRPLAGRVRDYASIAGLTAVVALMIFVTWNDLVHLRVFEFIGSLFS